MTKGKEDSPITYQSTGVHYEAMDPVKRYAQLIGRSTSRNLEKFGFKEVEASRGESAYVIDMGDFYGAFTSEGLGTKNLVADIFGAKFYEGSFYKFIAQDAVASIANDLITVGARPVLIGPHWAAGSKKWFKDKKRSIDLADGWTIGCERAGAVYASGETATLKGIVNPKTIGLSGFGFGLISPKDRLTLGEELQIGDRIMLIESNSIHTNGVTLVRDIVRRLPQGYATQLSDGKTFGETILKPAHIYANLINDIFEAGVDIHYMVNVTGHGWRKLIRANKDFTYVINILPEVPEEFSLIQEVSGNDDKEMYGNLNMGAGFAIYVPEKDVNTVRQISIQNHRLTALNAGYVVEGPKKVIIEPKNIVFDELGVR